MGKKYKAHTSATSSASPESSEHTHNRAQNTPEQRTISIAIQGGGSHGAFSWGVLDRLLEDGRFKIEGLTGTSAGGMNAVAVAHGLMKGGAHEARIELKKFWEEIARVGKHSPLNNRGFIDKFLGHYTMYHSPGFMMFDFLSRMFSPYELNPMGHDPLRSTVEKCFDFEALQKFEGCKLFLCATHVTTGRLKVFNLQDLSPDVLLATACLPTIHNAVKVDGEYYWDGGFIGNPVFFPLIYNCDAPDIVFIQLNPRRRDTLPTTSRAIADRLNEITNNASVLREMRAIHLISQMIDDGRLDEKRIHLHTISNESTFEKLGWSSKLNTEWEFLTHLFEEGRIAADTWIKNHYHKIGKESSSKMADHFIGALNEGGGNIYSKLI